MDAEHEFVVLSLSQRSPQTIRPFFADVDWVFHLAALADIVPSMQRRRDYHRSNVDGTLSVVEAARQARVWRFM